MTEKIFRSRCTLPLLSCTTDTNNSTWKSLNSGFIKYHSGGCDFQKKFGYSPTDIQLVMNGFTGIRFFNLFDELGLVNSSGKGMAQQPWVVSFKPGGFGWTLIS